MQVPVIIRPPALEPPAVALLRPSAAHIRSAPPELPFPPGRDRRSRSAGVSFGPQATPSDALPDPSAHARGLVLALLEVLSGRRPVQQLRPHLTEEAFQRLAGRLQRARATAGAVAPATTVRRNRRPRTRIQIGRTRLCEPADGIAEITVLADVGSRTRAVAVRLEGLDGRWRCPVLTIL
ncbi:Rv3235 family protein [Cryptosporangium sp. NPDC051539]|uniref:Rv3235 family protein n=1 Tax=Cryptosporangium sp. NPDC051539 TaxID=3363962 RepID=UPI0037BBA6E0